MNDHSIYEDIAQRTGGDIYLGVVGPVRTGKSTFIKRFMETLVIPNIGDEYMRERARDELPQSGSGRTIMTAEPKFVPEEAVDVELEGGARLSVRLIDCVGYMVDGAAGLYENGEERMVTTPWFDREIPMTEAAETGTRKVIAEHSTIGVVVTTDGSVTEIERAGYVEAEERAITELKEIGKPFLVLVNSAAPQGEEALRLRDDIRDKFGVSVLTCNCMTLTREDIEAILRTVLCEFPICELEIYLPPWVDALPTESQVRAGIMDAVRQSTDKMLLIRDTEEVFRSLNAYESVSSASVREMDLGRGVVSARLELPRELFYSTISLQSGFVIRDDGDLVSLLTELAGVKKEYDRVGCALKDVYEKGYGVVMPAPEDMHLAEPVIVRQGGHYGVRLKASAPSIHMIMANVETEVSPAVGGERSSEAVINFLLQEFEGEPSKIWESNIFGKSLYDIAGEGLAAKISKMTPETQTKLREMLCRVVNEGGSGLICIIL